MANWRANGGGSSGESGLLDLPNQAKNIGTRIHGGRMGTFNNTTQNTFQLTGYTAQHWEEIQLILATTNGTSSDYCIIPKISLIANTSDLNNSGGTWTGFQFNGQTNAPLQLAPVGGSGWRIRYTFSDWLKLPSIARDDGFAFPLFVIRTYFLANSALPVLGNGTNDDFTDWPTKPDGRIWCMRNVSGDKITTPSDWNSGVAGYATNRSQTPIIGVRYKARGKVITVMSIGDSIRDGFGATYQNESDVMKATFGLSNQSAVAVEYANCGWSGAVSSGETGYTKRAKEILDDVPADIVVFQTGTINDTVAGSAVTQAIRDNWRASTQEIFAKCDEIGAVGIGLTVMPCSYATHPLGASPNNTDNLRIAHNTEMMLLNSKGQTVIDVATPINGVVDANGQMAINVAYTDDLTHPNDAGYDVTKAIIQPALATAAGL